MVCPSARANRCVDRALRFFGGERLRSTSPIPRIAVPGSQRAGSIIVYNQGFESSRLNDLARWRPEHDSEIAVIKAKLRDLLVVIRRNVYYPAFGGSFSLKRIAAAILPDMNYDGLAVADGNQAGIVWARFVNPATYPEEKAHLKRALLRYCGQDTLALARILEVLLKQTRTSAG